MSTSILEYEYQHPREPNHDACARLLIDGSYQLFVYFMNIMALSGRRLT
jgi:hypothetical protein